MAQDPAKGILDGPGMAGGDQGTGQRRPAERVVALHHVRGQVGVHGQPEVAQPGDGGREAHAPCASLGRDRRLEGCVVRVHTDAEDVQLALGQVQVQVSGDGVDLHGRDEVQTLRQRLRALGGQLTVRGEVVVIRDGEQPDAGGMSLADELGGLQDSIGAEGVRVDVRQGIARDERRGPRTRCVAPGQR